MKKTMLLIVDPQIDFVDEDGALPVKGAPDDMRRLAAFIDRHGDMIDKILVTLDSHHIIHIATPIYWEDTDGNPPPRYSTISLEDVTSGKWQPRYNQADAPVYLEQLEVRGKSLIIWPPHCVFGSIGWAIYPELYAAIFRWVADGKGQFETHTKGEEEKTEMFSAIRPDVSFDNEKDGHNAFKFIARLDSYGRILIAGEAEDFCVRETVKDMVLLRPDLAGRFVLLKDCTSAISPDDPSLKTFWEDCQKKGLKISTSTEIL